MKNLQILQRNKLSLEYEKENFINDMCAFLEPLQLESIQVTGRPKSNLKDILKSLMIMSYHGMSYRRTQTDLRWMKESNLISFVPPRSTLNDYANKINVKELIEQLIQISSLCFIDQEDTLILDSTWFGQRMYTGGFKKVYDKKSSALAKVRKLHVSCLKNSKIITCAKATLGTEHDNINFKGLVKRTVDNGFNIKSVLADAGYLSKDNYDFCADLGIEETFIDFKKNSTTKRSRSLAWKQRLTVYKENNELWNKSYRYRVLIEGVFSTIKRKNLNYVRAKKTVARDVEVLLKALVYNLTVIGTYS